MAHGTHAFEDFETNPFYMTLENKYAEKFNEAQKKLWLICVPIYKSLEGQNITKNLIDIHILKPSPFFKSHFVTTDDQNTLTFELEGDSIKTNSGKIKILREETAYNDDYKPYRVLLIDGPLSCLPKIKDEYQYNSIYKKGNILSITECSSFLKSLSECSEVMEKLDKKILLFCSSYIVLPQYLQDASVKLQVMSKWAFTEFLELLTCRSEEMPKVEISAALENYIMSNVHYKIFPVIKKFCFEEDKQLHEKLFSLYDAHVTPDQLGVRDPFCCQALSAVVELASLNSESRNSPAEKLNCLMTTLELLNQDIEFFLSKSCSPVSIGIKESPCLTSDDLIPLLVNVVVQARPQYLASNLYYIQNFCWENSPFDKLSFGLVTFQAVKEFLKNANFEFLKPSTRKFQKELSLEELIEVTVDIQNSSEPFIERKSSTTDHLLENVTKMIEASTRELRDQNDKPDHQKENSLPLIQQENVGDFLSSLRHSSLGLSYGKQN